MAWPRRWQQQQQQQQQQPYLDEHLHVHVHLHLHLRGEIARDRLEIPISDEVHPHLHLTKLVNAEHQRARRAPARSARAGCARTGRAAGRRACTSGARVGLGRLMRSLGRGWRAIGRIAHVARWLALRPRVGEEIEEFVARDGSARPLRRS